MSEKSVKTAAAYGLPIWSANTPITADSLNDLSEGIAFAMQDLETRLSRAGGTINGPLEVADSLTRAGNAVYDTGNKPTAADVGALSKNGDTATGKMTFSGNAEIYDGTRPTYFELGKSGSNTTIEFHVEDHNVDYDALIECYGGDEKIGNAFLNVRASELQENGARVYSPNNKPTPAAIGALYEREGGENDRGWFYHFGNLLIQWGHFVFDSSGPATKIIELPKKYGHTNYSVSINHFQGKVLNDFMNANKVEELTEGNFSIKKAYTENEEKILWITIGITN